jgi:hypothetical protein
MELLFLDEALFGDTVLKGKTWNRRLTTKTKLFGGERKGNTDYVSVIALVCP